METEVKIVSPSLAKQDWQLIKEFNPSHQNSFHFIHLPSPHQGQRISLVYPEQINQSNQSIKSQKLFSNKVRLFYLEEEYLNMARYIKSLTITF